jgi:zinc protease
MNEYIMKKLNIALLGLFMFTVSLVSNGQATLVEEVKSEPGKAIVSYKKYKLPNGLTLMVHEDHSDPIVHVEVTYHVGSARETPGKSGFAHFFEHMMFQGSENVADEEHFKIVNGSGGTMNGTTNRDRTNYFETLPSNQLETALWLEADRMGFLLDAVTVKKFENQRSTVKNEKDQRTSVPYGMVGEVKDELLYPAGHQYSWPVIGYLDDLDSATTDDLKNFFMRWYGPNNAIVVVAGDVQTDDVVKLVAKYFGPIKKGPAVFPQRPKRILLPDTKFRKLVDDVQLPLTYMVYPTVHRLHPDEPALDMLSSLLASGRNSIFYKRFVESENALFAGVNHPTSELSGEFSIQVVAYPGTTDKETRDMIYACINDFEKEGFTDEDLLRVKESMIASLLGAMESIQGKSSMLTSSEMLAPGKKISLQTEIDKYRAVTKEQIWAAYKKYIKNKNAAIVNVVRDPALDSDPDTKKDYNKSLNPYANVDRSKTDAVYKGLSYTRPTDNFDRSKRPVVPSPKPVIIPEYYKSTMDNGVELIGTQNAESPMVTLYLTIKGGHLLEAINDFPDGTAGLTASMMNESTKNFTSAEISDKLQLMGSRISFSSGRSSTTIFVRCYKNKFDETLKLLEEKLFSPMFDEKDFKRVKKQIKESLNSQKTNPGAIAQKAFGKLMYGDESALGTPASGSYKTVSKISLDNVVKYHSEFYRPNLTKVVFVGDVSEEDLMNKLSFLKSWEKKEVTFPSVTDFPQWQTSQIFLVNRYYAKQSHIRIGYRSLPWDATGEYFKTTIMNYALGGAFNSRINLNLREDKGWTYGARSGFSAGVEGYPGLYMFGASVKTAPTDSAISEVIREINNYRENGITEDELEFTKGSMVSSDALRYETQGQKAGFLYQILDRNLDRDYRAKQKEIVQNMTVEEINALAKKYLKPEQLIILVVGSAYDVKEDLEAFGLGKIQTLDNEGDGKKKIYKP